MKERVIPAGIKKILDGVAMPDCAFRSPKGTKIEIPVKAGENVQTVWAELMKQMKEAKRPAEYVLQFGAGEHVITEPLCLDGSVWMEGVRLTMEGDGAVLTGNRKLDSSRFQPVEGKPYYRYVFEADENGNFPEFHFLTVNGRMIRPAQRGASRAVHEKPCLFKFRRKFDTMMYADNIKASKIYLDEELFEGVTERDFETMELHCEMQWCFDIVHLLGIDRNDRIPENNLIAVYLREEEYLSICVPFEEHENSFLNHLYWIENCLTFLEQPGTYFYNRSQGELYYYPEEDEVISESIFAWSPLENLLIIKNVNDLTLRGLTFTGVDHTLIHREGYYAGQAGHQRDDTCLTYAAIFGENIDGFSMTECTVRDVAGDGLNLRKRLRRLTISSNRFLNIGASAIRCGDFSVHKWVEEHSMKELMIENNYLEGIAWYLRESVALLVTKVLNARIIGNTIRDCSYSAINVGTHYDWERYDADPVGFNLRNVVVAFNYITDFMTDMRDGAAIYTLGYNTEVENTEYFNYILGNLIVWSDSSGDIHGQSHTSGLYNDNLSSNWLDYGNVQILNPERHWTCMFYHYVQLDGHNVGIHNNTYIGCKSRVPEEQFPIIYWNIDSERNVFESGTKYLLLSDEPDDDAKLVIEGAGCSCGQ